MKEIKDGTRITGSHWKQIEGEKPIICIDFDHTITTKCLACDDGVENDGIQNMAKDIIIALSENFRIWIYSGNPDSLPNKFKGREIEPILKQHGIPFDKILRTKPPACFIIDDRAIHHTSWQRTYAEILRRMKKRGKAK